MQKKDKSIGIRLTEKDLNELELIAKKTKTPISTIVRIMIETMILTFKKSETEYISNKMETMFETLHTQRKIIEYYESVIITNNITNNKALEKADKMFQDLININELFD
jgi:predicted DNA-binding protein